jgi:hypothetical protein
MAVRWGFRHYIDGRGASDVRDTYERGSKQLKARFLSRLRILAQLPQSEWHDTYYKTLSGPCAGLAEIRFKADKAEQRLLGFHSGNHEFTILFWAREKNWRFVPPSACETALRRKTEVLGDKDRADDLWIALE